MRIRMRDYLKWSMGNLIGLTLFGVIVYFVFFQDKQTPIRPGYPEMGINYFTEILINNFLVFIINVTGFIFFPITYFSNWFMLIISMLISSQAAGWSGTFSQLFPHALVEIPVILAYQMLAYQLFKTFWKTKKLKLVILLIKNNLFWLLWITIGIVTAAALEGFIG